LWFLFVGQIDPSPKFASERDGRGAAASFAGIALFSGTFIWGKRSAMAAARPPASLASLFSSTFIWGKRSAIAFIYLALNTGIMFRD
jgi:hypothetical protein